MAIRTFSVVSALVSALGVATAIAPTASAHTYDQAPAMFTNAAHLGDGSDPSYLRTQPELTTEPGYSTGANGS